APVVRETVSYRCRFRGEELAGKCVQSLLEAQTFLWGVGSRMGAGTSRQSRPRARLPVCCKVSDGRLCRSPGSLELARACAILDVTAVRARATVSNRLGELLDEVERGLGDLAPAVVDGERVAPVRDLDDFRHAGVAPLPLVGGVRDRPRHRVVLLAVDDEQ